MKKVFVTDGRSLAALAIARSLGQKGIEVHCGEEFRHNITFFSRYVKKRVVYPSPAREPERFMSELLRLARGERYDMIMPVRDETSLLLSKNEEMLSDYTNLYLGDFSTMRVLSDKGETVKAAQKHGIPCPKTYFPEEIGPDEIRETAAYPLLIRPRVSSGSRGILPAKSSGDFDLAYKKVKGYFGEPIIQEYIAKKGYCTACVLLDESCRKVASFTYERVKEYPISGGPTVVGVSCSNEAVAEYALKLLCEMGWKGVAEVEFIIGPDGKPRLLEVNPRFWMPLNLAIFCGVDFPYLLYRLATGESVLPVTSYKLGMKYRWVLPNEILWLMQTSNKIQGLKDFFSFWEDETCYGELSLCDPLPIAGVMLQALSYALNAEKRALIFNRGWILRK